MPESTSFDPVEVSTLAPDAIARNVAAALAAIAAASDLDELKAARLAHDGDRSPLALANREIGALPPAARKAAGQRVGAARGEVRAALEARAIELEAERDARVLVDEAVDVTLPWDRRVEGARHPLTTIQELFADVFVAMGYEVAEGPEIEAEWFNFDALNIAARPPGAIAHGHVLRRLRGLRAGAAHPHLARAGPDDARPNPPIYVVCPGKVFRTDELDATHTPVFHQIEGLVVDEGITMAHLKGTLDHMAQAMFGPGIVTRLRPSYFPFTEPSAELDLLCFVCRGESVGNPDRPCRTCDSEGWIEWGGCGMVNPAGAARLRDRPRALQRIRVRHGHRAHA